MAGPLVYGAHAAPGGLTMLGYAGAIAFLLIIRALCR